MNVRLKVIYIFVNTFMIFYNVQANKIKEWKVQNKLIKYFAQKSVGVNWQNGIVPYFFDTKSYDHVIANRLRFVMNVLESVSCIRFKPIIGTPNINTTWLHISNPLVQRDCMHDPQYGGSGEMLLVLGLDCLSEQQVLHTLMHGIGFKDEVSHPQRDQYIRILWNNIQPAYHQLFRIQTDDMISRSGVEYDPMSVMHFHDRAFSINGHATIAPLISGLVIDPSDSLSQLDTMKLRLLFGQDCNKRNVDDLLATCKMVLHQDVNQKNISALPEAMDETVTENDVAGNNTNVEEDVDNASKNNDENDSKVNETVVEGDDKTIENTGEMVDENDYNVDNKKQKIRIVVQPLEEDE